MGNFGTLEQLHSAILTLRKDYQPPRHLMGKVNSEYTTYLESGDYYTWLALAVRLLKPKRALELGNFHGASTIMIYSELSEQTESFTSVDIVRDIAFLPEEIINDSRVSLFFGNDLNVTMYGDKVPTQVDFLFIDTLHEYKQLRDEWRIYQHLCQPGALVVLDDIYQNDMQKFWRELEYPKLDITEGFHESGFGAFIYLPDEREVISTNNEQLLHAYTAALAVAFERLNYQSKQTFIGRNMGKLKSLKYKI